MAHFTARRRTPERMDDPDVPQHDLREAHAFVRRVNRWLGGSRAAVSALRRWSRSWTRGETIRILDIGAGTADIPLAILDWARAAGHRVQVTAVDLHEGTLALAREQIGDRQGIDLVCADARRLTDRFSPGDFDYAHAGMFLHHLDDIEVVTVLRIMDRLARLGSIWNDLVRGRIESLGVRVLTLGAPALVKHDAIVSVEAGFTKREAIDLARRAGLTGIVYRRHLFGRFSLTSEKQ